THLRDLPAAPSTETVDSGEVGIHLRRDRLSSPDSGCVCVFFTLYRSSTRQRPG
ncbi:unnamed protein product, partial [Laminaria digitata]